MTDSFSSYHPLVNFLYFAVVILCSMFFLHPVFLAISFLASFVYSVSLGGRKGLKANLRYLLPMLFFVALINPLFNHEGATILFYLWDNPITLESVYYGIASAVMFVSVIMWFACYNALMTSDKFIYLFGRIIPALSLIFSMVLRFVPRFKAQLKVVSHAQKCIGLDTGSGSVATRAKNSMKILSIMTTWALENAIETADSMRARGYGLPGRTSFAFFRFDRRDKAVLGFLLFLLAWILAGAFLRDTNMIYFPTVKLQEPSTRRLLLYAAYFLLSFVPVILNVLEEVKWRLLQSKI